LPLLNNAERIKRSRYGGYGVSGDWKSVVGKCSRSTSHVKALVHGASYLDSKIPNDHVLRERILSHEVAAFANDPNGQEDPDGEEKKANVR
jgi:hypothetical protein